MRSLRRERLLLALCLWLIAAPGCSRKPDSEADLEKKFQEMMTGVTLVGNSTRFNKEGLFGPERYRIDKVSKIAGDTWMIQARMQYGTHDLPIPVPVAIKWAGDTPVITLTDLTIPGAGTFTARVLLYRGRYAGTWSAKDHGGELFGAIVPTK